MGKRVYAMRELADILLWLLCFLRKHKKQGQQLRMRMERETLGHKIVVQGSDWAMEMLCDCREALGTHLRFVVIHLK